MLILVRNWKCPWGFPGLKILEGGEVGCTKKGVFGGNKLAVSGWED
jgi:hypothetical protein